MYLKRVRLKDWKSYANEVIFDFPKPTKKKNVVLIGAQNGHGKTSFLEALILGLYGKDGLRLVARASKDGDNTKLSMNYNQFIEKAFYQRALSEGRTTMTVEISFIGDSDDEQDITIERTWNFKQSGQHRSDDEQVEIWQGYGNNKVPIRAPRIDDPSEFLRSWIARHTLPWNLIEFFLFDGEMVQRFASRDTKDQVRIAIEGLLGAAVLRELGDDLNKYAQRTRQSKLDVGKDQVEELGVLVERMEHELGEVRSLLATTTDQLNVATRRRDELTIQYAGGKQGEMATLAELHSKQTRLSILLDQQREELAKLLMTDFALALSGAGLRDRVSGQLTAELDLSKWEGAVKSTQTQVGRFLAAFEAADPVVEPPLIEQQKLALRRKVEKAWQSILHPPPEGCAKDVRHHYLSDREKDRVLDHLVRLSQLGVASIEDRLSNLDAGARDLKRVEGLIAEVSGVEERLQHVADELNALVNQIGTLTAEKRTLELKEQGLNSQFFTEKANYGRQLQMYEDARPILEKAATAQRISTMLEGVITEAFPMYVKDVAREMTEAYKELAHKQIVDRVEIDKDCDVKLLMRNNRDIREIDSSAGENQIFSFALISAIARVSEIRFPLVIDTPLARLDEQHRLNVLRHFCERAGEQVILLSQDTEVVDDYYDALSDRVAKTFLIEHRKSGDGIGKSHVTPDRYFT